MFIFALIIPIFFGVFYLNNEEFFDTASEQLEDGYTWHYVGPTDANPELPSLTLQVEPDHPFVIFKLKVSFLKICLTFCSLDSLISLKYKIVSKILLLQ